MATRTWNIDNTHSNVSFSIRHLVIAKVRGSFKSFTGTVTLDETSPESSAVTVEIDAASIDTAEPTRDEHLRSADFFDAENHPELKYELTRVEPIDDESSHVYGNLTMHGVTREVKLHVVLQGTDTDPSGNERAGLEAIGALQRSDFDMKFNQALGSGNMLVGDKVKMALEVSAVKQP